MDKKLLNKIVRSTSQRAVERNETERNGKKTADSLLEVRNEVNSKSGIIFDDLKNSINE